MVNHYLVIYCTSPLTTGPGEMMGEGGCLSEHHQTISRNEKDLPNQQRARQHPSLWHFNQHGATILWRHTCKTASLLLKTEEHPPVCVSAEAGIKGFQGTFWPTPEVHLHQHPHCWSEWSDEEEWHTGGWMDICHCNTFAMFCNLFFSKFWRQSSNWHSWQTKLYIVHIET